MTEVDDVDLQKLYERLRRMPTASSIPYSLPVLFTGDPCTATIATVGLNPVIDEAGRPSGGGGRFETLRTLGVASRGSLSDSHCATAIESMRNYFQRGGASDPWYRGLRHVLRGMGYDYESYETGTAVHLDLVQEPTKLKWSELKVKYPQEAAALLSLDRGFLQWQVEHFPFKVLVCDGKTSFDEVSRLTSATANTEGSMGRRKWYAGTIRLRGRDLGLVGWNIPLFKAALDATSGGNLGRLLQTALASRQANGR